MKHQRSQNCHCPKSPKHPKNIEASIDRTTNFDQRGSGIFPNLSEMFKQIAMNMSKVSEKSNQSTVVLSKMSKMFELSKKSK